MTISAAGKLLDPPVTEPIVAVQFVKVAFPKSARDAIWLFTDGLSIIHSADNWLEK